MWDIGGQESLRSAWNTYYTNTEVILFRNRINNYCGYDADIIGKIWF